MQLRHLSAFCLLFAVLSAGAENVSKSRAHEVAQSFFTQTKAGSATLNLVWTGEENGSSTKTSSNDSVPFYVFNNSDGGFVIISGEDTVTPVLGYSDSGSFVTENMPEHVAEWFRQLKNFINEGRRNGATALASTVEAWNHPAYGQVVKLITTPVWGQLEPFNEKCPKSGGNLTVTGCVATAMAEILWTYSSPSAFSGTIPAYTTETLKLSIPAHTTSGTYNWQKMPQKSPMEVAWTAENREQVSTLMYDCGTAVQMDYTTGGSSAFSEQVPVALVKFFGMDKSMAYELCDYYDSSEWTAKLKESIDDGCAVYYSAVDKDAGGHAFVLDGYDSQGRYHINFGWYGNSNGYYAFPQFAGKEYQFSYMHQAVFGIKPDEGGQSEYTLSFDSYLNTDSGLAPSTYDIKAGKEFSISLNGILYNSSYTTDKYVGKIAVARIDKNGNIKELIFPGTDFGKDETLVPGSGYLGLKFKSCKCSSISDGDRAVVIHKPQGETEWKIIKSIKNNPSFASTVSLSSKETPETIAAASSFRYDKQKGVIEITVIDGAAILIEDTQQYAVTQGLELSGNKLTIDCSKLASEKYKVFINKDDRIFSFEFML